VFNIKVVISKGLFPDAISFTLGGVAKIRSKSY